MMQAADYGLDLGGVTLYSAPTAAAGAVPYLNRGFCHLFGFNHEESKRCFELAQQDGGPCAMAELGIAYALSSNYNDPQGIDFVGAFRHAAQAKELLNDSHTEEEHLLIEAAQCRYAWPVDSVPRAVLDRRYAIAMRKAHQQIPEDPDIATLYAESLMNLRPWALWDRSDPKAIVVANEDTNEIIRVLEDALQRHPMHPGLCHLYIHTMELGPTPAKALAAANVLRTRVPDEGHLLHMPSHIDIWIGQYHEATEANLRAMQADSKYVAAIGPRVNFYLGYRVHNIHFAIWSAMFEGRRALALSCAAVLEDELDDEVLSYMVNDIPVGRLYFESFCVVAWHVLVRFGMWAEILAKPVPTDSDLHATTIATAHYARGVAFAARGQVAEAEEARKGLQCALVNPKLKGRLLHNNKVYDTEGTVGILNVAEVMLAGELEYRKGNYEAAFDFLREAVRRDVGLVYDEPWGWMMPTRHALGALLLEQGQMVEATQVFRDDLDMYPNNQWALIGLRSCLEAFGKNQEAQQLESLMAQAQKYSELVIGAACFCARSK